MVRVQTAYRKPRTQQEMQDLHIRNLPCSAKDFQQLLLTEGQRIDFSFGWSSPLKAGLAGTRSNANANANANANHFSPLSLLRDHETTIVRDIFSYLECPFLEHVKVTLPADLVGNDRGQWLLRFVKGRHRRHWRHREREQWENLTSFITSSTTTLTMTSPIANAYVAFAKICQVPYLFPPA